MIWKASFVIRNLVFESPLNIDQRVGSLEVKYQVTTDDKGSTITVIFDTDVGKPPFLQQTRAEALLEAFKEISTAFVGQAMETELRNLEPVNEEDKQEYDSMMAPPASLLAPGARRVEPGTIRAIRETFVNLYSGKPVLSAKDIPRYEKIESVRMILSWYNRSLGMKGDLDRFISLWVTFNMIYDFSWRQHHAGQQLPPPVKRISDCIHEGLDQDASNAILHRHGLALADAMPNYLLIASKADEEALKEVLASKDVTRIEAWHQKSLDEERKELGYNTQDFLADKRGLDFGKYWRAEDWVKALSEVLIHIYWLRNMIFHEGLGPSPRVDDYAVSSEAAQYWELMIEVLSEVNGLLIRKILNQNRQVLRSWSWVSDQ